MTGAAKPPDPPIGKPEQAWSVLILVNDWVKHAESKAGATLAAAGVIGGVLYGLVKGQHHPSIALDAASVICGVLTLAAAFFGGPSLAPRGSSRGEPGSGRCLRPS